MMLTALVILVSVLELVACQESHKKDPPISPVLKIALGYNFPLDNSFLTPSINIK